MLTKDLGVIDWSRPARDVHNLVRGLIPWPGAFTTFRGNPFKIWKTDIPLPSQMATEPKRSTDEPGSIVIAGKQVGVRCGSGGSELIRLLEVQPGNRTRTTALDWMNGARPTHDERLGN
jgi:methionyl-tRNA formyltransferase